MVVSPLVRTMQTAANLGIEPSLPWLLDPDLQEKNDMPCDIGNLERGASYLEELGRPEVKEQYMALPEGWQKKVGPYAPDSDSVRARFKKFSQRLACRPESSFIAVAHDYLLHKGLALRDHFQNGEVRPYALRPDGSWRPLPPPETW